VRKRSLSLLFLLVIGGFLFADAYVGIDGLFVSLPTEKEFAEVHPLRDVGLTIVTSQRTPRVYLLYGKRITILESNGEVIVDFLDKYSNACSFSEAGIFVKTDILAKILGLNLYQTPEGEYVLIDHAPILRGVSIEENTIRMKFVGFPFEKMISYEYEDESLVIQISPCVTTLQSTEQYEISQQDSYAVLTMRLEKSSEPMVFFTAQGNDLVLSLRFPQLVKEKIAEGVFWEKRIETVAGKELLVNYLWIDPKLVDLKPKISSGGIGSVESVESMVTRTGGIAGVNANYFDPRTGMPIGLIVSDGKVLSTLYSNRPVFIQTVEGNVFIERISHEVNLEIASLLFLVKGINTLAKGEVLIYTPEFGVEIPKDDQSLYFVVENSRVKHKGWVPRADKGTYVIAIAKKYEKYLYSVENGDEVHLIVNTDFPFPIKHAIEAGPLLFYKGSPLVDREEEKKRYGNNLALASTTRTVAATLPDGRVVLAVVEALDGEGGLNYDELVELCSIKGFYSAMNFDGGSSSTMVIKGQRVTNGQNAAKRFVPVSIVIQQR